MDPHRNHRQHHLHDDVAEADPPPQADDEVIDLQDSSDEEEPIIELIVIEDSSVEDDNDAPAVANEGNNEVIEVDDSSAEDDGNVPAVADEGDTFNEDVPVDVNVDEGPVEWQHPNPAVDFVARVIRSAESLASQASDRIREALNSAGGSSASRRHRHQRPRLGCRNNDAVVQQQPPSPPPQQHGGGGGGGDGGGPPPQQHGVQQQGFINEWENASLPMAQQSQYVRSVAQVYPDFIRPLFQGLEAVDDLNEINTGDSQRNHHLPDGWTSPRRARVDFNLSFAPNTRHYPNRRLFSGIGYELSEPSLMAVVDALANVAMRGYSDLISSREVVLALILSTVVFSNRMPYDGVPSWHSNSATRPSFNDLARQTDPLQADVHAHLIRECPHITRIYHFGRPTFDLLSDNSWYNGDADRQFPQQTNMMYHPCTIAMGWMTEEAREIWIEELNDLIAHLLGVPRRVLTADQLDGLLPRRHREGSTRSTIPRPPFDGGMWLTGRGVSMEMNPELYAAITENEDEIDANAAMGYSYTYENAVSHNTTHFLGEWICSKCGHFHEFRLLNSRCGRDLGGQRRCNGHMCMARTQGGDLIEMTAYAVAPGCRNTDPSQKCIGLLNCGGMCSCGLIPRKVQYLDGYDMSQQTRPPSRIRFQAYRNGELFQNPLNSIKALWRAIRPLLVRGVSDGTLDLDWFRRNDMLPALVRYSNRSARSGQIIGDGDGSNLQIIAISNAHNIMGRRTYFHIRPRWSIVLEGIEYKVLPWSTREDLADGSDEGSNEG